jgi:hypothetical protein
MNLTRVEFIEELNQEQFEKFADFLAWLKQNRSGIIEERIPITIKAKPIVWKKDGFGEKATVGIIKIGSFSLNNIDKGKGKFRVFSAFQTASKQIMDFANTEEDAKKLVENSFRLFFSRISEPETIKTPKKELLDCIQNLMAVVDTPVGRKRNPDGFSEEARNIGRNILKVNNRLDGIPQE